jgi:hypothetical protein
MLSPIKLMVRMPPYGVKIMRRLLLRAICPLKNKK